MVHFVVHNWVNDTEADVEAGSVPCHDLVLDQVTPFLSQKGLHHHHHHLPLDRAQQTAEEVQVDADELVEAQVLQLLVVARLDLELQLELEHQQNVPLLLSSPLQ